MAKTPTPVLQKSVWKRARENWQMYLFLILPLVWLLIFKYYFIVIYHNCYII